MATNDSTVATGKPDTSPLFEPFGWYHDDLKRASLPGQQMMDFASRAKDVREAPQPFSKCFKAPN